MALQPVKIEERSADIDTTSAEPTNPPADSFIKEKEVDLVSFNPNDRNANGKYECERCGREYGTLNGLKYHVRQACDKYNLYRYHCGLCNSRSNDRNNLAKHIDNMHGNAEQAPRSRRARKQTNILYSELEDGGAGNSVKDDDAADWVAENEEAQSDSDDDSQALQKYRKATKLSEAVVSRSRQGARSSNSFHTFATVERPFVEAMEWTFNFIVDVGRNCPSSSSDIAPKLKNWIKNCQFDLKEFKKSPPFRIKSENGTKDVLVSDGIDAFEALPPIENSNTLSFCVGGPVRTMAWCPYSLSDCGSKQYLAISTHTGLHSPDVCYREQALIQLWDCGVLNTKSHGGYSPEVVLRLCILQGPVWDLKWCPIGGMLMQEGEDEISRLGILAAACSTGRVLIFAIPNPEKDKRYFSADVHDVHPDVLLSPCEGDDVEIETLFGLCLCVDWSFSDGAKYIAAGYSKGLVAIWKVAEQSALLTSSTPCKNIEITACRTFTAHIKPVRGVCWCPFHSDVFATASDDRYVRFWNKRCIETPIMEVLTKIAPPTEMTWPYLWCGVLTSTDEVFAGPWSRGLLYHDVLWQLASPFNAIPFKSSCQTLSFSNWMNIAIGADIAGNAVFFFCSNMSRKPRHAKVAPRVAAYSTKVKWSESGTEGELNYELLFHDTDFKHTKGIESRRCFKDARLQENFPSLASDQPFVQSVNRVVWNPNFGSHTWYASGLQCGLVRLHCVDSLHYNSMDASFIALSQCEV